MIVFDNIIDPIDERSGPTKSLNLSMGLKFQLKLNKILSR